LNKSELVAKVAEKSGSTKTDADKMVNALVETIQEEVKAGNSIELVGFGKFERAMQKGKEGKVPGTDKTYKTEDKYVPKFKVGKKFKDVVAG
jgi:DNA-binding protein HU-beta